MRIQRRAGKLIRRAGRLIRAAVGAPCCQCGGPCAGGCCEIRVPIGFVPGDSCEYETCPVRFCAYPARMRWTTESVETRVSRFRDQTLHEFRRFSFDRLLDIDEDGAITSTTTTRTRTRLLSFVGGVCQVIEDDTGPIVTTASATGPATCGNTLFSQAFRHCVGGLDARDKPGAIYPDLGAPGCYDWQDVWNIAVPDCPVPHVVRGAYSFRENSGFGSEHVVGQSPCEDQGGDAFFDMCSGNPPAFERHTYTAQKTFANLRPSAECSLDGCVDPCDDPCSDHASCSDSDVFALASCDLYPTLYTTRGTLKALGCPGVVRVLTTLEEAIERAAGRTPPPVGAIEPRCYRVIEGRQPDGLPIADVLDVVPACDDPGCGQPARYVLGTTCDGTTAVAVALAAFEARPGSSVVALIQSGTNTTPPTCATFNGDIVTDLGNVPEVVPIAWVSECAAVECQPSAARFAMVPCTAGDTTKLAHNGLVPLGKVHRYGANGLCYRATNQPASPDAILVSVSGLFASCFLCNRGVVGGGQGADLGGGVVSAGGIASTATPDPNQRTLQRMIDAGWEPGVDEGGCGCTEAQNYPRRR